MRPGPVGLGALVALATFSTAQAMPLEESDALFTAASERLTAGDPASAVEDLRRVEEAWKGDFGPESSEMALVSAQLGVALMNSGRHAAAIAPITTAVTIRARLHGPRSPRVRGNRHNLARCLISTGGHAEAVKQLEIVVASYEEEQGVGSQAMVPALEDLGTALRVSGAKPRAIDVYRRALSLREAAGKGDDPANGASHYGIGIAAQDLGDFALALRHQERARDLARKQGVAPLVNLAHFNVGRAQAGLGSHGDALASFEEALEGYRAAEGDGSAALGEIRDWQARSLVEQGTAAYNNGRYKDAIEHLARAIEIRAAQNPDELGPRSILLWQLAAAERRAGSLKKAQESIDTALELRTRASGESAQELAMPLEISAMILAERRRGAEARTKVRRAAEIRKAAGGTGMAWNKAVRAVLLDRGGDARKALAAFKAAAREAAQQKDPNRVTVLAEFSEFLLRHGKVKASEKLRAKMRKLRAAASATPAVTGTGDGNGPGREARGGTGPGKSSR